MTRADQLATVIELACLTEDRTNPEQRALLETARKCDDVRNRDRRYALQKKYGMKSDEHPLPDPSDLEGLADDTRVLEEGQKPVTLKPRKRRPWADRQAP